MAPLVKSKNEVIQRIFLWDPYTVLCCYDAITGSRKAKEFKLKELPRNFVSSFKKSAAQTAGGCKKIQRNSPQKSNFYVTGACSFCLACTDMDFVEDHVF